MTVFHLKYRPQLIGELNLKSVRESLGKIFKNREDLPQSFLLAGPKGSGKTSAARIIAKAVNCLDPKDGEPCNKCENCVEITRGKALDVIEMDAASNRGIEDVRALKEKAYLLPVKLMKKVFIIDEVHMLTKEAFNALLKLIEEPPVHTFFILCTTDAEKIPETIISRLVRVNFKKARKEEVYEALNSIIEKEGLKVEEGVIELVEAYSEGSFRNAHRMLNEIFLELGKKIKLKDVMEIVAEKRGDYFPELFEEDLIRKDVKRILEKIEEMAKKGVDFRTYTDNLVVYFQERLLSFYGMGDSKKGLSIEEIKEWLRLLINTSRYIKEVKLEQLPLEIAVVDFIKDEGREPEQPKVDKLKVETKKKEIIKKEPEKKTIEKGTVSMEDLESHWGDLLTAVKPFNHSVEAFLRAARPKGTKGNWIILEVFYQFHKDKLEEERNRKIVETGLKKVFGKDLLMECVLGKNKKPPLVIIKNEEEKRTAGENKDLYDVAKEIFG